MTCERLALVEHIDKHGHLLRALPERDKIARGGAPERESPRDPRQVPHVLELVPQRLREGPVVLEGPDRIEARVDRACVFERRREPGPHETFAHRGAHHAARRPRAREEDPDEGALERALADRLLDLERAGARRVDPARA